MTKIRTLVVDDEPLARERVLSLLQQESDVEVVGECSDGGQAVSAIQQQAPDLVFLDVQMPGCDGFEVIRSIGPDRMPTVVFVTAYDEYALRAFEVHALDYLLKPFDDARFARALDQARERARSKHRGETDARIAELLAARAAPPSRFLVPLRDKTIVVEAEQIDWIEAADYYVSLHVTLDGVAGSHLLRQTMDEIASQLDPRQFFRVHRSAIVNIDRVREIHPLVRGDCALVLADGRRLKLSRTRRKEFESLFAQPRARR